MNCAIPDCAIPDCLGDIVWAIFFCLSLALRFLDFVIKTRCAQGHGRIYAKNRNNTDRTNPEIASTMSPASNANCVISQDQTKWAKEIGRR